jgi:hypothetical protein
MRTYLNYFNKLGNLWQGTSVLIYFPAMCSPLSGKASLASWTKLLNLNVLYCFVMLIIAGKDWQTIRYGCGAD